MRRTSLCLLILIRCATAAVAAPVDFAIIGDFGNGGAEEAAVADRLKSYAPDFVVTLGDNNYLGGSVAQMDLAIGRDYHPFIKYPPNSPSQYASKGATQINFYPLVGNHDWDEGIDNHSNYYTFPRANTRYYDFARGPVHFFMLDSDPREPDGTSATSPQADWLRTTLAASHARWKLVLLHHPPYTSTGGGSAGLRWPFADWGAHAVLSGHAHNYEHLLIDGAHYIVNGLGGEAVHRAGTPIAGSRVLYDDDFGFMFAAADDTSLAFRFVTRAGAVVDHMVWQDDVIVPATPEPGGALVVTALAIVVQLRRRTDLVSRSAQVPTSMSS